MRVNKTEQIFRFLDELTREQLSKQGFPEEVLKHALKLKQIHIYSLQKFSQYPTCRSHVQIHKK